MSRVLIVDDEAQLRRALRASLAASGFEVAETGTADEALAALKCAPCDLVLLDINMPGTSGLDACSRIRKLVPRAGIVMVTVRDSEDDKVRALEAGADDFITKPYRFRELLARLRAVLRRVRLLDDPEPTTLRSGDLELDVAARRVTKAGSEIHLSPTEFDLLALLFRNAGMPRVADSQAKLPAPPLPPRIDCSVGQAFSLPTFMPFSRLLAHAYIGSGTVSGAH